MRVAASVSRRALYWVLAYVFSAALWIGVMQWLLSGLGGASWSISTGGLIVGALFVLLTAWLLFLLLSQGRSVAESTLASSFVPWQRWGALVFLIVGTLGAQLFMAWYATREYRPVLLDQAQTELTSQIRLHSKLLDDWLAYRQKQVDAILLEKDALIARLKRTESNPAQSHLPEFSRLITQGVFDGIAVFNTDHVRKLQFGSDAAGKGPDSLYEKAAASSTVQFACVMSPKKISTECYWILPVFLSTQEVSAGPWFVLFSAGLSEAALLRSVDGAQTAVSIERAVRSLLLLMPTEGEPVVWQTMPLIADFSRLTNPQQAQVIAPLSAEDLSCLRQSGLMNPAPSASTSPPSSGQIHCGGESVLYAAAPVPKIGGVLWAATTQDSVLLPLLHTRRWFAGAALLSISAFLIALFYFWHLMRSQQQRSLARLIKERNDCAAVWSNLPSLGLAVVAAPSGKIQQVNSRWAQLFQTTQAQAETENLAHFLRPAPGLTATEQITQQDAQWLAELSAGLREEVQITRYVETATGVRAWLKFSLRAPRSTPEASPTWLVAVESLGDTVIEADAIRAERDLYRWLAHVSHADQALKPDVTRTVAPDEPQERSALTDGLMGQSSLVALCLYTHWPPVWASAPDLSGPVLMQQEQQSYVCEGCTAPVRAIANEVARMGVIDRVLVAQTPIFIDDAVRQAQVDSATGLQAELIEQLQNYPVGALAVVPLPPSTSGQNRAWIAFGADGLRFTAPVRAALLLLLNRLCEQLPDE